MTRFDRIAGTTSEYTYDSSGNLATRDVRLTRNDDARPQEAFTFDKRDRMTRYQNGSITAGTYEYDDGGRLVRVHDGLAETTLRYDLDGRLVSETRGLTHITYAYNPLGLESMTRTIGADDPETFYYEFNTHGDTIHLVDATGDTVVTYHYDGWGNLRSEGDPDLTVQNRFTYSAQSGTIWERTLKMYYMGIRWYDPTQQRFISEDPAGTDPHTSANTYAYANNNPITNIDTTGLTGRPVRTVNHTKPAPLPEPAPVYPAMAIPTVYPETPRAPVAPAITKWIDSNRHFEGEYTGPNGSDCMGGVRTGKSATGGARGITRIKWSQIHKGNSTDKYEHIRDEHGWVKDCDKRPKDKDGTAKSVFYSKYISPTEAPPRRWTRSR